MLRIADRAKETTTTTGTGPISLGGAAAGALAIGSVVANGDQTPYCIDGGAEWEVGIGTYASSGNTLTRSTVLASSNAGALVSFSAGIKGVFVTIPAVVAAGGLLPIPFAATIPFRMSGTMPTQSVTGAIAFTPDNTGAVDGVQVLVDLLANGTNIPTFTGFREWDGSSGWVNTTNVRNCVTFFRRGGASWYTINQQLGATAESVPATGLTVAGPSSGVVSVASTAFTVAANGPLSGSVTVTPSDGGAGGTFTPTTVALNSGTTSGTFTYTPSSTGSRTLTVTNTGGLTNPAGVSYESVAAATVPGAPTIGTATASAGSASVVFTAPASNGGAPILDYTATASPGGATATGSASPLVVTGLTNGTAYAFTVTARNSVGNSSPSAASNSVTPAIVEQKIRYNSTTVRGTVTETGNGTTGYSYTCDTTGATYAASFTIAGTPVFPVGAWASVDVDSATLDRAMVGVSAQSVPNTYQLAFLYSIYNNGGTYFALTNGGPTNGGTNATTSVTAAAGHKIRMRRIDAGATTTLVAELSNDGGATWPTTLKTWTGIGTGTLYLHYYPADVAGGNRCQNIRGYGLAA